MATRSGPRHSGSAARRNAGSGTRALVRSSRKDTNGVRAVPGTVPSGPPHVAASGGFSPLGRAIFDKLDRGVVLLDARGAVVDANSLAASLLDSGDGIAQRNGRFAFSEPELDRRFARLLAPGQRSADTAPSSIAARVKRAIGAAYRVVVSRVGKEIDDDRAAFIVLIFAPNQRREIAPEVLKELYGLTPAQADVACTLYEGRSVEATATALGLSLNTVRSHLKQIFSKCEVQTQAELQHLLALGPHTF